jgi:hypothetical protein
LPDNEKSVTFENMIVLFIQIIASMRQITLFLFITTLIVSCKTSETPILVEAESFSDKGGWVVAPQFVEQMGSPYLLAHGLGLPVEDAKTDVSFSHTGEFHVWIRTMNWSPGEWEAPGRFKIEINDTELETELGTEPGWNWQYAGTVNITKKRSTVVLKDLTGFDGRCDAIYFSKTKQSPPNEKEELKEWRKTQLREATIPKEEKSFDVVITGGGIAGCAAAIASAEQGLKVALIHDRPVLGGNASSEIRVHTLGVTWKYDRILRMLNTEHYPNGSPEAVKDDEKRMSNIKRYGNINLFLNTRAYGVNTINDSITSVDARHTSTGVTMRFSAPLFIDCTGDGWIGYWAGAEYVYGREDSSEYNESWSKYGELWSPSIPDNRVMGSSVLWRSVDAEKPITFPDVPWAMDVAKSHSAINGEWYWEYSTDSLNQIDDAEQIRDHMLKAIYGSFWNAKQKPENSNIKLEWVSYLVGKRESRRLKGDYIYTFNDAKNMTRFKDAVVKEVREIDVHYQQNLADTTKSDFLSEALFYKVKNYYIPYRSLYSRNIKNLFMAGRCFSCSHIGLGGPRVMNTTGQMGAAVGYAASLCNKHNTIPADIYQTYLSELLELIENGN